jgi:hypothetical protein
MNIKHSCILILSLGCAGCAQMTPFYGNSKTHPQNSIQRKDGYSLTFVEFGEQGSYQDPTQIENALALIKSTPRPLVVTYVHGWQNNARSGDAERFSGLLRDLSESEIVRKARFNVIGVYLGWRGQLTKVPVMKELTFFSRKAAAERLASNFDCYDAIAAVSEAARKYHAADGQYTILLGHSFGGLVVERSVAHAINAEIHGRSEPAKSLPADLILLLNPASDSILTRQMIAALYSRHLENTREFVVSLTSTGDAATGLAFPLGTSLAAVTKGFNEVRVPGMPVHSESERKFFTTTPGHNKFLINHKTEDMHKTLPGHGQKAFDVNLSHYGLAGHVFTTDDGAGGLKLWHFQPVGAVNLPYWDVAVDPLIIKDHGDIWNERARAMMAAIFRMNIPGEMAGAMRPASVGMVGKTPAIPTEAATMEPKPKLNRKPDYSRLVPSQQQ